MGKPFTGRTDVLRMQVTFPALKRQLLPGPYYDDWRLWHALTIRNWVARAVATVKGIRPAATVSVYVGSWYGDYFDLGSNWAADDFQAGYRALTDAYRKTGYAGHAGLDDHRLLLHRFPPWRRPTRRECRRMLAIEAAGQLSNRCANDHTWVYAGILLDDFRGNPDGLARALQAAAASTQGIMVFDLSHHIEQFWPVFQQAFSKPAIAPHAVPGLLALMRANAARLQAAGIIGPPVIIENGVEGMTVAPR